MNISGKQQFVTGYPLTFAMPIGFSMVLVINLNQTEHQVEAIMYVGYALPVALPIILTLYNWSKGLSNRATGLGYSMPFFLISLLALNFTLVKN